MATSGSLTLAPLCGGIVLTHSRVYSGRAPLSQRRFLSSAVISPFFFSPLSLNACAKSQTWQRTLTGALQERGGMGAAAVKYETQRMGWGRKKKKKHGGMKVSVRIKASSGMTLSVRNKVTLGLVTDHCGHYTERNNLSYTFSDSPSKTMQQSSLWMEDTALMDQWSDLWAEVNGDRIKTDERTSFNRQYILPNSVCAIHPTPRKYGRLPPIPPTKS